MFLYVYIFEINGIKLCNHIKNNMLKFTTTNPFTEDNSKDISNVNLLVIPPTDAKLISSPLKGRNAYIMGKALLLAGFSLPCFFDGDIRELDKDDGEILMVLPSGEYPIICRLDKNNNYALDLR